MIKEVMRWKSLKLVIQIELMECYNPLSWISFWKIEKTLVLYRFIINLFSCSIFIRIEPIEILFKLCCRDKGLKWDI